MKMIRTYKIEPSDPNWKKQLDEAFNRLMEYTLRELKADPERQTVYNRVVSNGEFTLLDLCAFKRMADRVVESARGAVPGVTHPIGVVESIEQAADHLSDLVALFEQACRVAA